MKIKAIYIYRYALAHNNIIILRRVVYDAREWFVWDIEKLISCIECDTDIIIYYYITIIAMTTVDRPLGFLRSVFSRSYYDVPTVLVLTS